jgi:hypothetical protein
METPTTISTPIDDLDFSLTPTCIAVINGVTCGKPAAWLAVSKCCGEDSYICGACKTFTETSMPSMECSRCGSRGTPGAAMFLWHPL